MMPMMQLRRADQHSQWTNGQPNIGMNVNRPQSTKCREQRQRFNRKSQCENRQIHEQNRVDRIDRMLAMRRQPIEMLGAVMDAVKPPEKSNAMLQAMTPVDKKIAEQHDNNCLSANIQ